MGLASKKVPANSKNAGTFSGSVEPETQAWQIPLAREPEPQATGQEAAVDPEPQATGQEAAVEPETQATGQEAAVEPEPQASQPHTIPHSFHFPVRYLP